jgi:hypothetical protein
MNYKAIVLDYSKVYQLDRIILDVNHNWLEETNDEIIYN